MRSIVGLFGRSPFRPLAQHTEKVNDTVQLVRPLMEAFMAGDWSQTADLYKKISKLEHKADVVKTDIRDHLPSSLFMPVDRGDILLFLKEQDSIADAAEDVAVLVTMRETPTPESMKAGVLELVDRVLLVGQTWFETAHELPLLEEASFTGPEVDTVLAGIQKISDLEWEADKQQAEMSRAVIRNENEMGAVSVMFWMNILRELGTIANKAENTADLLRLMLAKR
jgi:hypothetical protein